MFLRRSLDVTHAAAWGAANEVVLRVAPPDHVGCVDRGGQGGDHHIAKDVTAQYVAGWDWTVPVPDRNTGLWDHVEVEVRLRRDGGGATAPRPRVHEEARTAGDGPLDRRLTLERPGLEQTGGIGGERCLYL